MGGYFFLPTVYPAIKTAIINPIKVIRSYISILTTPFLIEG